MRSVVSELTGREYRRNVADTRVLMALVSLYERRGRVTLDGLVETLGVRKRSTVHERLFSLRDRGLIAWEPGKSATLRPLVTVVAHG